jgi:uncharacterized OB-fold protein
MSAPLVTVFRDHLKAGELVVQKCSACSQLNMYPRYACPFCQSEKLEWQRVSGKGTLQSFTVLRLGAPEGFEGDLPYALGVIRLKEGVQLLARLIPDADGDWSQYVCDQSVQLAASPEKQLPYRPCAWFRRDLQP